MSESPTGFDARREPQPIPGVFVNPGSGPVTGATKEHALANAERFAAEVGDGVEITALGGDAAGRWSFLLTGPDGRETTIEMPGLPLESVRYMREGTQNAWHYPRLYVNGGSWLWLYGVNVAQRALFGEEGDK